MISYRRMERSFRDQNYDPNELATALAASYTTANTTPRETSAARQTRSANRLGSGLSP